MKINILDKSVYNRIAAGEVVERPFSVIKELVENSIDAGSKHVKVSIVNGGKDCIEVEDDGCGIEKEELVKALMPHATSKIKDVKDLDEILTLGFRGEALASIASVSKLTITSKPAEQEFGARIYSEGGVLSEVTDYPSNGGTKITVEDLFFNTPVRAKFLKTTRSEEGDITDVMCRLILANPFVAFKYYVDGKLVLQSFGDGEEEAFISVYGCDALKNCFRIETVKNGIAVKGYIGRHFFTKPNRTYQTLIINGRYVVNQTVSLAVQNAYQSYLMKRQYPFYVLTLTIPAEAVDVNVHPNKKEVRFNNNQVIYGSIYSVVSKVLDGTNEAIDIVKSQFDDLGVSLVNTESKIAKKEDNLSENIELKNAENNSVDRFTPRKTSFGENRRVTPMVYLGERTAEKTKEELESEKRVEDAFAANKKFLEEIDRKSKISTLTEAESKFLASVSNESGAISCNKTDECAKNDGLNEKEKTNGCNYGKIQSNKNAYKSDENILSNCVFAEPVLKEAEKGNSFQKTEVSDAISAKVEEVPQSVELNSKAVLQTDLGIAKQFIYVGQAFKTYLIFQKGEDLYFIDQHAAHERIIFDVIYERAEKGDKTAQPLLIPYVLELNSAETEYFLTRKEYLEQLGFVIDEFGRNCFKITEVPLEIADMDLKAFFNGFLSDNSLKQEKVPELIREKLCQRACKAAIKAGYDLSKSEIDALLVKMNGNMGLKCPHGRPVAVRITETEIEKWFKRIV